MRSSILKILLYLWYTTSLAYITFYGITKGVGEYFCYYKSYGPVNYNQFITTYGFKGYKEHNTGITPFIYSHNNTLLFGVNWLVKNRTCTDCIKDRSITLTEVSKIQRHDVTWVVGESKFEMKCKATGLSPLVLQRAASGKYLSRQWVTIGEEGFLSEMFDEVEIDDQEIEQINCNIKKADQVCDIPKWVTNRYLCLYTVCSMLIFSIWILSFLPILDYLPARMIFHAYKYFSDINVEQWFCNPVTSAPIWFEKGEIICKLSNGAVAPELETFGSTEQPFFEDLSAIYLITDNLLFCKDKKSKITEKVYLDNRSKIEILKYFSIAGSNPKLCCLDFNESHYLETRLVIQSLIDGFNINLTTKSVSGFALDVHEFELKYILENFDMKKDKAWVLLEHNWAFFKQHNIKALENCLTGKTNYYHAPKKVNNATWRWYTSDFCKLNKILFGFESKSQSNWRSSWALINTLVKRDKGVFDVVKLPEVNDFNVVADLVDYRVVSAHCEIKKKDPIVTSEKHYDYSIRECITKVKETLMPLKEKVISNAPAKEYKEVLIKDAEREKVNAIKGLNNLDSVLASVKNALFKNTKAPNPETEAKYKDLLRFKDESVRARARLVKKEMDENKVRTKKADQVKEVAKKTVESINDTCVKIIYYENISKLLDEHEMFLEQQKSNTVTTVKVSVKSSDIIKRCLNSKLNDHNKMKIRRRKSKIPKKVPFLKRKTTVRNCYKHGTFIDNLRLAQLIAAKQFVPIDKTKKSLRAAHEILKHSIGKRAREIAVSEESDLSYRNFVKREMSKYIPEDLKANSTELTLKYVEEKYGVATRIVRMLLLMEI